MRFWCCIGAVTFALPVAVLAAFGGLVTFDALASLVRLLSEGVPSTGFDSLAAGSPPCTRVPINPVFDVWVLGWGGIPTD